jgi:hypothetical protein
MKDDLTKLGKEMMIHEFEVLLELVKGCTGDFSNLTDQEFSKRFIRSFEVEVVSRAMGVKEEKRKEFLKGFLQAVYEDCSKMLDQMREVI